MNQNAKIAFNFLLDFNSHNFNQVKSCEIVSRNIDLDGLNGEKIELIQVL